MPPESILVLQSIMDESELQAGLNIAGGLQNRVLRREGRGSRRTVFALQTEIPLLGLVGAYPFQNPAGS